MRNRRENRLGPSLKNFAAQCREFLTGLAGDWDTFSGGINHRLGPLLKWLKFSSPLLVGVLLLVGTIVVLEMDSVEQLSDVFSPSTRTDQNVGILLPFSLFGNSFYPFWWILDVVVGLGVWGWLLYSVWRVLGAAALKSSNYKFSEAVRQVAVSDVKGTGEAFLHTEMRAAAAGSGARKRLFGATHRIPADEVNGREEEVIQSLFLHGLIRSWIIPSVVVILTLFAYSATMRAQGSLFNPAPFAMLVAYMILASLALSITYWLLGAVLHVGFWRRALSLAPWIVFVIQMFSTVTLTDRGKGILNQLPHPSSYATLTEAGKPLLNLKPATDPYETEPRDKSRDLAERKERLAAAQAPLVFLTCAGGGSRAAIFNATTLAELYNTSESDLTIKDIELDKLRTALGPLEFALLKPPGGTVYYPGRILLNRTDIISAISGGGLAVAYYQDRMKSLVDQTPPNLPIYERRAMALKQFFEGSGPKKDPLQTAAQEPPANEPYTDQQDQTLVQQFEQSPFLDEMAQDYLGSIIVGEANPFEGRTLGIEDFWDVRLGWKNKRFDDFYTDEDAQLIPHLILNSTDAVHGTRVAITNLDQSLFTPTTTFGQQDQPANYATKPYAYQTAPPPGYLINYDPNQGNSIYDPHPGYVQTFARAVPGYQISLSQAVHANSNFPIGFPVMRFQSGAAPQLELLDGGILDNTGMDTAMSLVRTFRANRLESPVLVLEIDTSELSVTKVAQHESLFLYNLTGSLSAINLAGQTEQAVSLLEPGDLLYKYAASGGRPKDVTDLMFPDKGEVDPSTGAPLTYVFGFTGNNFGYFYVKCGDTASDHVPTSWHLSLSNRAKLYRLSATTQVQRTLLRASEELLLFLAPPPRIEPARESHEKETVAPANEIKKPRSTP